MLISQPNEKHHFPFYPNWYLPIIPKKNINNQNPLYKNIFTIST